MCIEKESRVRAINCTIIALGVWFLVGVLLGINMEQTRYACQVARQSAHTEVDSLRVELIKGCIK